MTIIPMLLLFAFTVCAQQTTTRSAIDAGVRRWTDAAAKGDAAALAALYTDDAMVFPSNSDIVKGNAAVKSFWQGFLDSGIKNVSLNTIEVDALGNTAIETGTYTATAADGKVADRGKYIVVWKRIGNNWKIHRDIFNTSMPAPATK
jgi:uncharacterized protein (TIGR02246 family)